MAADRQEQFPVIRTVSRFDEPPTSRRGRHDNVATKTDLRELELRLEAKIDRIVVRLGALIVIVAGLASTIVHFWR